EKILLCKRSIIETVFDIMKNPFELERSILNTFVHFISTLIAYCLNKSAKPSIKFSP
ncbi:MAG: IS982 family transposase, partial [Candidatus Midichloria sp.]